MSREQTFSTLRCLAVGACLWLFLATVFLTDAACDFLIFLFLMGSGGALGVAWLAATVYAPPPYRSWVEMGCWVWVPLAGLQGCVLAFTDRPLALRVELCESDLRRHIDEVAAGNRGPHDPRFVGLFHVDETRTKNGATFLFTSTSFIDRHGVAYIPPGASPSGRFHVRHLRGNWYSFYWKF